MNKNEKRHAPRVSVTLEVQEEKLDGIKSATASDISEIGMCYMKPILPSEKENGKEKESFLEFMLPGDVKPIKVLGWIVREEKYNSTLKTAVTFMFLPKEDEKRIRQYVQSQSPN